MDLSVKEFPKAIQSKILNRTTNIELVISEKCQNSCSYCYRVKKHNASQVTYVSPEKVRLFLTNYLEIFDLDKSFFKKRKAELFGGDACLNYQYLKEILHILTSEFGFASVTVPTNSRMIQELSSPDLVELLQAGNNKVVFSLSVDGSPQDPQRSLSKFGKMLAYDEEINYEKLVSISKKFGFGFHPMLTFDSIDTWLDTTKFFNSHNVTPYLLEVRHPLSTEQSIKAVTELVKIRQFLEPRIPADLLRMSNTICLSIVPRGLGCSAHTTATIMPNGDIPFCHRVVDSPWVLGNVLEKTINFSKMITMVSVHDHRNHPLCISCSIRNTCAGQCAGASYEYWGDPWIPIESVCNFLKLKTYIMSTIFKDWKGIYQSKSLNINKESLRNEVVNIFGENKVSILEQGD